jgi:hypothetical protein
MEPRLSWLERGAKQIPGGGKERNRALRVIACTGTGAVVYFSAYHLGDASRGCFNPCAEKAVAVPQC